MAAVTRYRGEDVELRVGGRAFVGSDVAMDVALGGTISKPIVLGPTQSVIIEAKMRIPRRTWLWLTEVDVPAPRGVRRRSLRRVKKWLARQRWEARKIRAAMRGSSWRWTMQAIMARSLLEEALREPLFPNLIFDRPGLMPDREGP